MEEKIRVRKQGLAALKIAFGSSLAIYIAYSLHLQNEVAAGIITLLTVLTTKWETVRLTVYRMLSLMITIVLAVLVFENVKNEWVAFGIFIFVLVLALEMFGWMATLSVNAVIGGHFLMNLDFGRDFILNEIYLVVIGVTIALVLNLFHPYETTRKTLIAYMRRSEQGIKELLVEVAGYLSFENGPVNVWVKMHTFEETLQRYVVEAVEYQDNTFASHPGYYIDYFEMRLQQCHILHNLHGEIKKIRQMPAQAEIVREYILYLAEHVKEKNHPKEQIEHLEELFTRFGEEELPKNREEFESRAILYHIIMDLEDFVICKQRFIRDMSPEKRRIYWDNGKNE